MIKIILLSLIQFLLIISGNSDLLIAQEREIIPNYQSNGNMLVYKETPNELFTRQKINNMSTWNPNLVSSIHAMPVVPVDGLVIDHVVGIGINLLSTGSNAIQVVNAGVDGVQIQSAGRDGIRVSSATDYGINASETKGAGFFDGEVFVNGDLTAQNIGINSVPYFGTKISVVGNTGFSGNMCLTSGSPSAGFASNILEVELNSPTDPIADAWTTYSSVRWKKNIRSIDHALAKVQMLHGRYFDWKIDGKHDIGLIAEEVADVIPEIVTFEENGVDARSVDYSRIVALLIEAIKEQQLMIKSLNARLEKVVN